MLLLPAPSASADKKAPEKRRDTVAPRVGFDVLAAGALVVFCARQARWEGLVASATVVGGRQILVARRGPWWMALIRLVVLVACLVVAGFAAERRDFSAGESAKVLMETVEEFWRGVDEGGLRSLWQWACRACSWDVCEVGASLCYSGD